MKLYDVFGDDPSLFPQMMSEGFVRRQFNFNGRLAILNYSEKAQFARMWNDVTLNCRGFIYDTQTEEVIARGYKKFFNWDDASQPYPPTGPCFRAPKMDGSLGILYKDEGRWSIATRGSFHSDQATWATAQLALMQIGNDVDVNDLRDGYTYLCEIIYPENRIVVDYGGAHRLVLLDALHTDTGVADMAEFDRVFWLDKVVKTSLPGFQDTMAADIPEGDEGFVFYWPQKDFRVKMKAAEYIELHRMIFGLNARSVWARLGEGETAEQIAVQLPDEFHSWVRDIADGLVVERDKLITNARREWARVHDKMPEGYSRKDFAVEAIKSPMRGYIFMLEDNKSITETVWQAIKPAGGITFNAISEDVA